MFVSSRALPLCVWFLCATAQASSGICKDSKCYAFFQKSVYFTEGERDCQSSGGTLLEVKLLGDRPSLPLTLPHGHFWIRGGQRARAGQCWSVLVTSEDSYFRNRTCSDQLDGVVCQYLSTCRALPHSAGAEVTYTGPWSFEGETALPPGNVAVVRAPGQPPSSKHVCTGRAWMRAPWSCEVLRGGCEHDCVQPNTCTCPAGHILHQNNFTCMEDPCAPCTHSCAVVDGKAQCRCREGYKLGPGGRCVDVDECSADVTLCSGPGEECLNTEGSYECVCQEDYDLEDGKCLDRTVCDSCEQDCEVVQGEFRCTCKKGFRVDPQNPHKCKDFCTERDCPAKCPGPDQCHCPDGYISHKENNETICSDIDECEAGRCDHLCTNTFGGFFCECEEGFLLQDDELCVPLEPQQVQGQQHPTAAPSPPTAIPSYVKTGSILGIAVFALLCAAVLYFLLRKLFTHCSSVQFYTLKQEMDIFTLQQVSTETYKRLSHDWQIRTDCHRL